jgi:hypothetical protein
LLGKNFITVVLFWAEPALINRLVKVAYKLLFDCVTIANTQGPVTQHEFTILCAECEWVLLIKLGQYSRNTALVQLATYEMMAGFHVTNVMCFDRIALVQTA